MKCPPEVIKTTSGGQFFFSQSTKYVNKGCFFSFKCDALFNSSAIIHLS